MEKGMDRKHVCCVCGMQMLEGGDEPVVGHDMGEHAICDRCWSYTDGDLIDEGLLHGVTQDWVRRVRLGLPWLSA